jgi:glycerophosphoryl diester phosphodiesterase
MMTPYYVDQKNKEMVLATIFYIILAHYLVSAIFLIFPTLIKKPRVQKLKPFIEALKKKKFIRFAHRGGPLYKLENTIPAFRHSLETFECEFIELDVHLTKDKQIVVYHDYELTRIFGKDIETAEANYNTDFKNPKSAVKLHFHYNKTANTQSTIEEIGSNNPIAPLLKDVLSKFPNAYFNIDVKAMNLEAINKTIEIIKEAKAELRVNVGSVKSVLMRHFRKNLKASSFWASGKEVQRVLVAFVLGFLPYIDFSFDSFHPPYVDADFLEWETKDPYIKNSKLVVFLFRVITWIAPILYPHLTKRGIVVVPWTVNLERAMENLVKIGANGVISDDPKLMQNVVKKHNVEMDKKARIYS